MVILKGKVSIEVPINTERYFTKLGLVKFLAENEGMVKPFDSTSANNLFLLEAMRTYVPLYR